jgi:diguanylate cyclase (GGDEF)-like protein
VSARTGSFWLVAACVLLAVPTGVDPEGVPAGLTYLTGLGLIVAALWWGSLRVPRSGRGQWMLISAAGSCWLAGDIVQRGMSWIGISDTSVGPPDVFWLASYPLLIAGVIGMIKARGMSATFIRDIRLDVIVVGAAASVVASSLLITPALAAGDPPFRIVVGSLYPLGDVAIFALAITLMLIPGSRGVASLLLVLSLGLSLPLDLLQAVLPEIAPHLDGARFDGAQLVVNALLGAAAIHPSRHSLTRRADVRGPHFMNRWRVVLLGASLCSVSIVSAIPTISPMDRVPALAASVLVSVAVMIRFYRVVREREEAEDAQRYQADHDQLTGVANRFLLMSRLSAMLRSEAEAGDGLVLASVDLDGFKTVNDTWGHPAGDEVIRTIARRLSELVRATDTVARVGGDEFVVLCHGASPSRADDLGRRICEVVGHAIDIGAAEVVVGASVGVVTAEAIHLASNREDLLLVEGLLRRADSAMYEAKRGGGGVRMASTLSIADSRSVRQTTRPSR